MIICSLFFPSFTKWFRNCNSLDQRYQHVCKDDGVRTSLCRCTEHTEDSKETSADDTVKDSALRSDRRSYIISCHEECTEDQTTTTYFLDNECTEITGCKMSAEQYDKDYKC